MKIIAGKRRRRGQSTVEFALVLPIFLIMVFALMDLARYFFYEQSLSHTVRATLRASVTGKVDENPDYNPTDTTSVEFFTRRETIIRTAKRNNVSNVVLTTSEANAPSDTLKIIPSDGGGPGDDLTISITYDFEFITPLLNLAFDGAAGKDFDITVSTTYTNEQFDE